MMLRSLAAAFVGFLLVDLAHAAPAKPGAQIDIVVQKAKKTRYSGADYDDKVQGFQFTVRLKNKEPSKSFEKLKAHLYVIGKEVTSDIYHLLDKQVSDFDLPFKGEHEFSGNPVNLDFDDHKYMKHGTKYDGFIVLIFDEKNEVIASKSTKASWMKNVEKLKDVPVKSKMSDRFVPYGGAP